MRFVQSTVSFQKIKHYILGYMDGVIDCSNSDQKKEENKKGA